MWWMGHPSWASNASSSRTDSMWVTQSMTCCWMKPRATNLIFCLTTLCPPEHEHSWTPLPLIDCKPWASPSCRGSSPHGWCASAVSRCCCWLPSPCTGHRLHWWIEGERAVVSHLTTKSRCHIRGHCIPASLPYLLYLDHQPTFAVHLAYQSKEQGIDICQQQY